MIFFWVILIFSCVTIGCGVDYKRLAVSSVSEMQRAIFVGQSQGVTATLTVGYREKEYVKDGCSGDKIPFAIMSFGSVSKEKISADSFVLFSDGKEYEEVLLCNPFTGELQADLGTVDLGKVMACSLMVNDREVSIALLPLSDEFEVSSADALDIVIEGYRDEIKKECISGGKFCGEIYVKYCGTLLRGTKDGCWGVTIITSQLERLNFVVSAKSGEVLAH